MALIGFTADRTPYNRRLTKRTRRLNLYNQNLVYVDLAKLKAAPNLEILELSHNPLRTLDLRPLRKCPRLEQLVVTAQAPIDLAPLARCKNLRVLHVYADEWPALDLAPLAELPHFESLSVHGGAFEQLDLAPVAECPLLRRISLHCPTVRDLPLAPVAKCRRLESLHLEHTPLTSLSLSRWPELKYFNLLGVPLEELDLVPLADSALERLTCVGHELPEVDLTPLVEQEKLDDTLFKPTPRLLLDDYYAHHPRRIASPSVRQGVKEGRVMATGRYTRLKIELQRLAEGPLPTIHRHAGMDEDVFWRLIEEAAGQRDMATALLTRLVRLPPEDLRRFHELFWHLMGRLPEETHPILYEVLGGCSDDCFLGRAGREEGVP
jgi:hypothetical protein